MPWTLIIVFNAIFTLTTVDRCNTEYRTKTISLTATYLDSIVVPVTHTTYIEVTTTMITKTTKTEVFLEKVGSTEYKTETYSTNITTGNTVESYVTEKIIPAIYRALSTSIVGGPGAVTETVIHVIYIDSFDVVSQIVSFSKLEVSTNTLIVNSVRM
eukprot:GHVP01010722.1.p1 GENE.GHVP01010722.1~~GHVP01010722.1.p1  ORF type:complete len:157 (+),score=11.33 GHVP01010722.1:450-920(+)